MQLQKALAYTEGLTSMQPTGGSRTKQKAPQLVSVEFVTLIQISQEAALKLSAYLIAGKSKSGGAV